MTRSPLHRSSSEEREPCCRTGMPKERGAIHSVAWRRNERLQSMRKNLSAVAADLPAALLDTWLAVGIIGGSRVAGCV